MEKAIVYFCPRCRRVCRCGTWEKINEEIARILTFAKDKYLPEFKHCGQEDCAGAK
jgi:hypothetical protein